MRVVFARRYVLPVLVLVILSPLYFTWTWTDQLGYLSGDAPAYLVMAQHYTGRSDPGSVITLAATYSRFPPLYPVVLAQLHAATDLVRAHAVNTALLLSGLIALFGLLCVQGLLVSEAALLTLLFAALPGTWLLALSLQSEFLYLPLSSIALLGMYLYQQRREIHFLYLAAAAIAGAVLTRSVGAVLLAPMLLAIFRVPKRAAVLALALAALPPVLWSRLHSSGMSYGTALSLYYGSDPWIRLLQQVDHAIPAFREGLETSLTRGPHLRGAIEVLAMLAAASMFYRAWRLELDAVYLISYLAVVLAWPFAEADAQRYLWPVLGLLLAQPVLLLKSAVPFWPQRREAALLVLSTILLAATLPAIAAASVRFRDAEFSGIPGARSIRYWYDVDPARAERRTAGEALAIGMLKDLEQEVPPGDCIISIRPDLIHYFAHRWSGVPPPELTPEPQFSQQLRQRHCRYLFMTTAHFAEYPTPLYPFGRLSGGVSIVDHRELPPLRPGDGQVICVLARLD